MKSAATATEPVATAAATHTHLLGAASFDVAREVSMLAKPVQGRARGCFSRRSRLQQLRAYPHQSSAAMVVVIVAMVVIIVAMVVVILAMVVVILAMAVAHLMEAPAHVLNVGRPELHVVAPRL